MGRGRPRRQDRGVLTDWLDFVELDLPTGTLWGGDPFVANAEDGACVSVAPGRYLVQAKGVEFSRGERLVARLRVLAPATSPELGPLVGQAGTDSGLIAVGDIAALDVLGLHPDAIQEQIEELVVGDYGLAHLGSHGQAQLAYVATAWGDGTGPVFVLRCGSTVVGAELDFMGEGSE